MLTGYCAGWSLRQLIQEGLGGVPGKITSSPASHLATLCNQMVNFLGIMQNEWAGAQAFSSFDTYLAPFVKSDDLSYRDVKKCIESFIFGVNTPSRWGTQAPFSNITLDWTVPGDLAELNAIVGGVEMPFKYKDCKKEMDMVNKAFIEIMIEGDANGRGFQYPIPTYSITKDFDWSDTENNRLLFEMTSKYGTPYFSNYINSDMEPSDVRSMCCRLRLDLRELRKKSGGFFGSGESTGSVGVVTINMPRIAYLSENEADFYKRLDKMMNIAARSLSIKRSIITRLLDEGLFPYTKRYLGTLENHFSTIGLLGMNEAGLNAKWLRADMTDKRVQEFSKEVLTHMRGRLSGYQEEYGDLYNLEATPAESTSYRLAKHDKEHFSDILTASEPGETPYYTNSSHLPVGFTDDIFEALDVQDGLQTLYTSGTVFHAFLGEKLSDWKTAATLVKKIAENYTLPYYTLSPTYSICTGHGYIGGEQHSCPQCGRPTEIYSRITGYYRPVRNWNDGKLKEFKERKTYDIDASFNKNAEKLSADKNSLETSSACNENTQKSSNSPECHCEPIPNASTNEAISTKFPSVGGARGGATPYVIASLSPNAPTDEAISTSIPLRGRGVGVGRPHFTSENSHCEPSPNAPTNEAISTATPKNSRVRVEKSSDKSDLPILLFTTKTCPNCKTAYKILSENKIPFQSLDADENEELVIKYAVRNAPTLIVINDGGHIEKYANIPEIRSFA
jgi:ribonucleoside-triphosphate reductase